MSKISVQVRVSSREAVLIGVALREYGSGMFAPEADYAEVRELWEKVERAGVRALVKEKRKKEK